MVQHGSNSFPRKLQLVATPIRSADRVSPDLSRALASAMEHISPSDRFLALGRRAAAEAGCEMLFEIPAVLFQDDADQAAAIRCDRNGSPELFFLLLHSGRNAVTILEEDEVPEAVLDFALSYAGVLSLMAADGEIVRPLLH